MGEEIEQFDEEVLDLDDLESDLDEEI